VAISQGKASPRRASSHRWSIKRESSSHKTLSRSGWPDVVFAFHDKDEIGPKMLARIAKNTGLKPEDL
jgi:predicted RNA binding protein YcfA (HicA-like mRNA interferase family)